MNNELLQLLLSLRIGDGCFVTQSNGKTYRMQTNGVSHDYIAYKRSVLDANGIKCTSTQTISGYCKDSNIIGFRTVVNEYITAVAKLPIAHIIDSLDLHGLIYYYLDDGTLHKRKHFMHLYCNSFTVEETNYFIDKLYKLFPYKRCTLRFDRKKDGRCFPYIYVPVSVAKELNLVVRDYLIQHDISSLLYKTFPPSQTIETII